MASVVQICNMALAHIGAGVVISSINPPDGSLEAGYCDTYYNPARLEMLEIGTWKFSLARVELAEVTNTSDTWAYAYALPSNCLRPLRILAAGSTLTVFTQDDVAYSPNDRDGAEFDIEGAVLYTNEPEAVLVYTRDVTDSTQFTPSFMTALSYLLGSYLAGPIIKGTEGMRVADAMRQRAMVMSTMSATADANASSSSIDFTPSSIAARA